MNKTLALLVALLLGGMACGQESATSAFHREQYAKLGKMYAKESDNVGVLIDMALLLASPDNPQYNLPQAAEYLRRAEALYIEQVQDRGRYRDMQKLLRRGVTLQYIRQQRAEVDSQAVLYVRQHVPQMTELEISSYLKAFGNNTEIVRRLRGKRLMDEYQAVCEEDCMEVYYDFMQAHPNSVMHDTLELKLGKMAESRLSGCSTEREIDSVTALFASSRSVAQAAMRQKSRLAFRQACQKHTAEAYGDYMRRFPRGDDYVEALSRQQSLTAVDYTTLTTPLQLADYATDNNEDPTADSARARLRQMITEDHNREAVRLYLERFPLDEHYPNVYREYYSWYATEGNRQPLETFARENPEFPYRTTLRLDQERAVIIDSLNLNRYFTDRDMAWLTNTIRKLMGTATAYVALQRAVQQPIAAGDWNKALSRMRSFDLCFEDAGNDLYTELEQLLTSTQKTTAASLLVTEYTTRAVPHPKGRGMYYSQATEEGNVIVLAKRRNRRDGQWIVAGEVTVAGTKSEVIPYNFYDGGKKVLVGIDGDIWTARVVNDTLWKLDGKLPEPMNSQYTDVDAFMLEDGSGILLASDRPEGFNTQKSGAYFHGDTALASDIYFIPNHDGKWGDAVNLGSAVNSIYCERSPMMSRDMKTLYFVTDARGMGHGDVYRTTRTDINDWRHWSVPVNMGKGVSTGYDEMGITPTSNRSQAIISRQLPYGGKMVFLEMALSDDTNSIHVTKDISIGNLRTSLQEISVVDLNQSRVVARYGMDDFDTMLAVKLHKGKKYAIMAVANWLYLPTTPLNTTERGRAKLKTYTLDELKKRDTPLPLMLVAFNKGGTELSDLSLQEIDGVVRMMRQHAGCSLEIMVNVDGKDEKKCYDLSLQRALKIRNYMVAQGIELSRILIAPCGNLNSKKNQRTPEVEIRFL